MHGDLHRRELATVLALAGGPIARGVVSWHPADLTDLAPTVLALLGVGADGMDGTPLAAARTGADAAPVRETVAGTAGRTALSVFRIGETLRPDGMMMG
jgi:arylsulfatase A-like enzyme